MFIHQYDSGTGAYISSRLADPDPNSDGWLVPAFSTTAELPARTRHTWPFFNGEAWVLQPDYRGILLYRCDSGTQAEILVPGISPEQAGLTTEPRPSAEYHWVDGWVLNPEAVAARERAEAMAAFDVRMERARTVNFGKADALAAGLLTPAQKGIFKAWAEYQMALVRVVSSPDFPRECEWPDEPDEAAAAAAGEAEAAAEQARLDAHAEQERKTREAFEAEQGA
ncbi:tail fiber assembly [Ralstonia phage RS-PII-1]|uniref:Putative tail fiber assembly protein n=1 Tax=Ralstonia phage RS-PII-1 TaxID=1932892 RepID=A0A1L7DQ95_9CAUD|nr:tail fiber assembly [Ralstonia phage RS-PII-1]APU00297.1 putative tail fiber assembly protein [Ralstonia phage RS-PII-1]